MRTDALRRLDALPRAALPVGVGVVACVLRLWVWLEQRAGNPLFRLAILDDRMYLDIAHAVGEGTNGGIWFVAPLYPYALGLVGAVTGPPGLATAALVNLVAGTATAILVACAARTLHSQAAGWLAGVLVAAAGTFVFHDVLPGQEPLLALLHVAGFWAAVCWVRSGALRPAAGVGVATAISALGRGTSLAIAAGASLAALLHVRPARRGLVGIGVLVLAVVAGLAPAALRNRAETGALSPFPPKAGIDLYMSNCPTARAGAGFGAPELGMSPHSMQARWRALAEASAGRALSVSEVDAYWLQRTWDERGSVGELAAHAARKALLFFAASEYGSNHFVVLERRYATWLQLVPVSGWWILALGVGGWWLVRRRLPAADAAAATIALAWLALVVFYPVSRYRLPVLPLAAILAAAGVVEALAGTQRRRLFAALGIVAAITGIAHAERLIRPPPEAAVAWVNLATAHVSLDEDDAAAELLRDATERWPADGPAHFELARLHLRQGRPAESLPHLDAAARDSRTRLTVEVPRMGALLGMGDAPAAERLGLSLLDRLPPVPSIRAEMLAWWALTADALGNRPQALRRLDAALQLDAANEVVRAAEAALR